MKSKNLKTLILAALFLSIGIVLPLFTMQIKEIGDSLLPMHIPVMLCGILCNKKYGFAVGLTLPFIRSLLFSMPPIYPNAVWMALELCTYGFCIGLFYDLFKQKSIKAIYISLIASMLCGRIIWGISKALLLGLNGKAFTFAAFITGGIIDAMPGIIIQLILIPLIVGTIKRG